MDYIEEIKKKFSTAFDVNKQGGQKQKLKEDYFNGRMRQIQDSLQSEEEELTYRQKFDLLLYMKVYMSDEEKLEVQQVRKNFSNSTYISTLFGFASVLAVACVFRSFQKLNGYGKCAVSLGTFGISHYSAMFAIQQESEQLCDKIIERYQDDFLKSKFVVGQILPEQQAAANTILSPTTNIQYQYDEKKKLKEQQ